MSFKELWAKYCENAGAVNVDRGQEMAAEEAWDYQQAEIDRLRAALRVRLNKESGQCPECGEWLFKEAPGTRPHKPNCPHYATEQALGADDE